ncbi:MAG: hypothetical protein ACREL3_07555 [Gemmatimonadales bacterium]
MTTEGLSNLLAILGALSGVAVVVYNIGVRPRVYYESRYFDTVNVSRGDFRARIEAAVRDLGLATNNFEVSWWNRGHRTATEVRVEVTSPVPIRSWEILPREDDAGAGWKCARNPSTAGGDPLSILITQEQLMPGGRCRLLIGFDADQGRELLTLHVFVHDRRARPARGLKGALDFFGVPIVFGTAFLVAWLLNQTEPMITFAKRNDTAASGLTLLCGIIVFGLMVWLLEAISPGDPWKEKERLRRRDLARVGRRR